MFSESDMRLYESNGSVRGEGVQVQSSAGIGFQRTEGEINFNAEKTGTGIVRV